MNTEELLKLALDAAEDMKAVDMHSIDVRGRTSVTDHLLIVSGTSARHVKSIADNIVTEAKKAGQAPLGVEGEDVGEWILVDLGDVVVHVMLPEVRDFYNLEKLWSVDSDEQARQH